MSKNRHGVAARHQHLNKKIGEGVCRRCKKPINWRKAANGRVYAALQNGGTQPHICEEYVHSAF